MRLGRAARMGGMLVAPRATLGVVDGSAQGAGMIGDAVLFIVARFFATQLPVLVVVVWRGFAGSGRLALPEVLRLFQQTVFTDLVVILGAAVIISVAAGKARRAERDAELAAASWLPFAAIGTAVGLVEALLREVPRPVWDAAFFVALAWTLYLVVLAIGVARRRAAKAT